MKTRKYLTIGLVVSLLFWFLDSGIHYFLYGELNFELVPSDINELWMRILIIVLIISFALYADAATKKLLAKEKQLEAARIHRSMVNAAHHILNNLLNQMQLFKLEALRSHDFDREVIQLYDHAINEASGLIRQLSEVEEITSDNILASVAPGNNRLRTGVTASMAATVNKHVRRP